MTDRDRARLLAFGRIAIGTVFVVTPRRALSAWTGAPSPEVAGVVSGRAFGARDLALGMGLLAGAGSEAAGAWLRAGALADAFDAAGTLLVWRDLPRLRRWAWLAAAAGATWLGLRLASRSVD